jgi:hypothetical protein
MHENGASRRRLARAKRLHITCYYLLWLQVFTAEKRHPMHRRSCSKSSIPPISLTLYSKSQIQGEIPRQPGLPIVGLMRAI